jgi:type II secretory pathway pseudopilin PulG
MLKDKWGFTVLEIMLVFVVVIVAFSVGWPSFKDWMQMARYRASAREIVTVLRDCRSRSVSQCWEHRVEFDLDFNRYRLLRGNKSRKSTDWSVVVRDWKQFPSGVQLASGANCSSLDNDGSPLADLEIQLNANGTSGWSGPKSSPYLCVMGEGGRKEFRCGIWSSKTGRVVIHRWDAANSQWR